MKKIRLIIAFTLFALVLSACNQKEKYEVDKVTSLKGTITINPIIKDGETKYISILELNESISIDGVITDKIEIEYDKSLKNNTETTITGTIKKNEGSTDLKYAIEVDSIDNILSYINSFSNDIFSVAIPAKLMKSVIVNEINDGFAITIANTDEIFKVIAMSNDDYKKMSQSDVSYEKIKANKNYTVVLVYPSEEKEDPEVDEFYKEIPNIKSSVKLK